MLLLPLLVGIIYTLSTEQWLASLVFIALCVLVLYKGLVRLTIQANSFVACDGNVVMYIPKKTVRDRFDFASRNQTIVHLPSYGLLDRPYEVEIFSPDNQGGLNSCCLSLTLGYVMEMDAWQRLYDNFVRYEDQLSLVVKKQLLKSSAELALPAPPLREGDSVDEYLEPIIAELNRGLESTGLKIEKATCGFSAGPILVRLIAAEQKLVDESESPGEVSQEDEILKLPA
jgi:hypothetical protein